MQWNCGSALNKPELIFTKVVILKKEIHNVIPNY